VRLFLFFAFAAALRADAAARSESAVGAALLNLRAENGDWPAVRSAIVRRGAIRRSIVMLYNIVS
jgi:hypothetical protein